MAAVTEYYVDPATGTDDLAAGRGASAGDPWATLKYAIETGITPGSSGDRVNLKAGTADNVTTTIDPTLYGTPTASAPLIIQGYTSTAGDGGIGQITGTVAIINDAVSDFVMLRDLDISSSVASSYVIQLDRNCIVDHCKITGTGSATITLAMDNAGQLINSSIIKTGGGVSRTFAGSTQTPAINCYFEGNGNGILTNSEICYFSPAYYCVVKATSTVAVPFSGAGQNQYVGCTCYSSVAHTGPAFRVTSTPYQIIGCYAEGFSGTGGAFVDFNSITSLSSVINCAYYNCSSGAIGAVGSEYQDLTLLSNSGLSDASTGDWRASADLLAAAYVGQPGFESQAWANIIGAYQREASAGGGIAKLAGFGGGLVS